MSKVYNNDDVVAAGDLVLCNGNYGRAGRRTVASEIGLAPATLLQYMETRSRWTGTGYRDSLYRVVGTDDRVVISHNNGLIDNIEWETVEIERGFFNQARAYGTACRKAARKYKLGMEAVLAVGPENAAEFAAVLKKIVESGDANFHELSCGIDRRKTEQCRLFAKAGASEQLMDKLSCGQRNSYRISDAISRAYEKRD